MLPPELDRPEPGSLLLVPYGRRLALGYLMPDAGDALLDGAGELRAVEAVVSGPMLTADLMALASEIAAYYRAPIGTTLAAMLPPGLESRVERRWSLVEGGDLPTLAASLSGAAGPARWPTPSCCATGRPAAASSGSLGCAGAAP